MGAKVILSVSEDGFCGSVERSKSPFDGLRMISRLMQMSRFKIPSVRIHYRRFFSLAGTDQGCYTQDITALFDHRYLCYVDVLTPWVADNVSSKAL